MVPPLVTASRCAPGRPVSTSAARSQTSRGRSSAKAVDGYRPDSMSSTPASAEAGSSANGAARRTTVDSSDTGHGSIATIATICWASTSSGLRGYRSSSIAPAVIRSVTTAQDTRSPRCLGNTTPCDTAPTWCPARPTRCRPDATLGGASICTTRSTAPMSMPSSRLDVATTAGSCPDLSASSICLRSSRDTLPWWARATTGGAPVASPDWAMIAAGGRRGVLSAAGCVSPSPPWRSVAISLSRAHSRSAPRRELVNTMVDRCASIRSYTRSSTAGQMDARRGVSKSSSVSTSSSRVMSSTGTTTSMSNVFAAGGATTSTGALPPRNRAVSSIGRTVADRPMRCAGRSSRASNRSRDSAR